jgi:hypothetical protein
VLDDLHPHELEDEHTEEENDECLKEKEPSLEDLRWSRLRVLRAPAATVGGG